MPCISSRILSYNYNSIGRREVVEPLVLGLRATCNRNKKDVP